MSVKSALTVALLLFATVPAGWAQIIEPGELDPATLHIGTGAFTACAQGCGGHPNLIPLDRLSIYQTSNGNGATLVSPLLLIVGIPNFDGAPPLISSVDEYDLYLPPDIHYVGPAGFVNATGPTTKKLLNGGPDAYPASGYNSTTNNSNSYVNWSGAAAEILGYSPSYFGLYAYQINATLEMKGLFDVRWEGAGLPLGTIAVAYGCSVGDPLEGHCAEVKNTFSTPFTEAGMATPEPASILLLGTGLLAAASLRRKKIRTRTP